MTGNELMSGDIIDSNSAMIAQRLKDIGVEVKRKVTVSDDFSLLVDEISHIAKQADVLIVNGGLGPTSDDLTAEALAKVAGCDIDQHSEALTHIMRWCADRGAEVNEPNLKQTMLPKGCDIVANSVGSAVGIKMLVNNCTVICTPGVPRELKVMLDEEIIPFIKQKSPDSINVHTTRFQLFGYGESGLQKMLAENFPDWPESLEIGFRASLPLLELKITSRSTEDLTLKQIWLDKLQAYLGDHVIHEITDAPISIAQKVLLLLKADNKTLTTAESCTGGLIASLLTKEAGASASFHAGFVTYDNAIKSAVLNVDDNLLAKFGAVSEETVKAMAVGALAKSNSDYVIAVSGIAGPDGGTEEKPVGTVWIAWGDVNAIDSVCLQVKSNRWHFQNIVAAIGLDLIRRKLQRLNSTPRYFIERKAK